MKEYEIEFYKKLAQEIKPLGFRCFLFNRENAAWLYVITPNNSWLYIDNGEYSGYNVSYEYQPSQVFGSGCRYNEKPLHVITDETLLKAEQYGKKYGYEGWEIVSNQYDRGIHREKVWKTPEHYPDGLAAMQKSWCADELVEL